MESGQHKDVWHARLGHPSHSVFSTLMNKYHLPLDGALVSNKSCHICPLGKSCQLPFEDRQYHAQFPLALLNLIYGVLHQSPLILATVIISLLLMTIPDLLGYTHWLRNQRFLLHLFTSKNGWRTVLVLTLNNCRLMVEVNLQANYL